MENWKFDNQCAFSNVCTYATKKAYAQKLSIGICTVYFLRIFALYWCI